MNSLPPISARPAMTCSTVHPFRALLSKLLVGLLVLLMTLLWVLLDVHPAYAQANSINYSRSSKRPLA